MKDWACYFYGRNRVCSSVTGFMRNRLPVFICILAVSFLTLISFNTIHAEETVIYSEGFESDNGGYTLVEGTAEWEWGTPLGSIGPSGAHSGSNCWGTDLDNTLDRLVDGSITSPAISLPALDSGQIMRVRFWAWVAIDGMLDRGEFLISQDGTNWTSLCEFFQSMDSDASTAPAWRRYEFSIPDSYADGTVYLRFRTYTPSPSPSFYCSGSNDLAGFYIDDIAITLYDVDVPEKLLSLEAWEDPSAYASCPWIAPWNGEEFEADNDIYSVARYPTGEFTDYYKLMLPLVETEGVYRLEIQEREKEDSFTDYVALLQIDHEPDVKVAPDENGELIAYTPEALAAPVSAVSDTGQDVLGLVSTRDDSGFSAYNENTVTVDFGDADVADGARLLLRVAGFIIGEGEWAPYSGPPAIVVETQEDGQWQERGRLLPRFRWSEQAFDLSPYLSNNAPRTVRLRSISHATKYHSIDYVALDTGIAPEFQVNQVELSKATFGQESILDTLLSEDGEYVELSSGEKMSLEFAAEPVAEGMVREFVFVSRGYYIPKSGTYLIYTWDGNAWVQRDALSYPGSDYTHDFDLSLFLPDPDGEYKVRIWQDYQYEPAAIDYTAMSVNGTSAPLLTAWDFHNSTSCFDQVLTSDDLRTSWGWCPRNRVIEVNFDGPIFTPPTTDPVTVDVQSASVQIISWTYQDLEGDQQEKYEVEVWSGSGGSGDNMWDPAVGIGDASSIEYAGAELNCGIDYYARVKAYDGTSWGAWSEGVFQTPSCNTPPVAVCQDVTVTADENCQADADINTGSYDPDLGDSITLQQNPSGPYPVGETEVTLTVTDQDGEFATCEAMVTVVDNMPPVPNVTPLPLVTGGCSATISSAPTAQDNCAGTVTGTTSDPLSYNEQGTYTVTWTYDDGNENTSTQTQQVVVDDVTPPDVQTQNITIELDESGNASITDDAVNNGSTDNCCDDDLKFEVDKKNFSCSDLGENTVTLKVTDCNGNSSSAPATVTVEDNIDPTIEINAPETIIPPDAPISFTATVTDNCSATSPEVTGYYCYGYTGNGREHSKMQSCVVDFSGDTLTILDSGGVDDNITWTVTASDQSGNTTTARGHVLVANPGKGEGKRK